nr:immunoglobulin heavy chain junction region [Mus musculus]
CARCPITGPYYAMDYW